jgi:hypothetical protein
MGGLIGRWDQVDPIGTMIDDDAYHGTYHKPPHWIAFSFSFSLVLSLDTPVNAQVDFRTLLLARNTKKLISQANRLLSCLKLGGPNPNSDFEWVNHFSQVTEARSMVIIACRSSAGSKVITQPTVYRSYEHGHTLKFRMLPHSSHPFSLLTLGVLRHLRRYKRESSESTRMQ